MSDASPPPPEAPKTARGVAVFIIAALTAAAVLLWYQRPAPVVEEAVVSAPEPSRTTDAAPVPPAGGDGGGEIAATEAGPAIPDADADAVSPPPPAIAVTAPETTTEAETGVEAQPETVTAESGVAAPATEGGVPGSDATPGPEAEAVEDMADAPGAVVTVAPAVEPVEATETETAPEPEPEPVKAPEPEPAPAPSDETATPAADDIPATEDATEERDVAAPSADGAAPGPAEGTAQTVPLSGAPAVATDTADPALGETATRQQEIELALTTDAAPTNVAPGQAEEPAATDTAPTFDIIRIDATGAGLVAGKAEPFSTVQIMSGSTAIATVEATASGEFVAFIQTPAQDEGLQLSLLAQTGAEAALGTEDVLILPAQDEAGVALEPTIVKADTRTETVRIVQPSALGKVAGVTLDAISYDESGAVRLSGRTPGAQDIRIYVDGAPVGVTQSSEAGTWDAVLTEIQEGRYVLRVDALREDGTVASRAESPFQRVYPSADQRRSRTQITVQPGNTLWVMAQERYGSGILYTQIFAANRDSIRDPDLIYPGQIFALPSEDEFIR